jgi:hypothetical protein
VGAVSELGMDSGREIELLLRLRLEVTGLMNFLITS